MCDRDGQTDRERERERAKEKERKAWKRDYSVLFFFKYMWSTSESAYKAAVPTPSVFCFAVFCSWTDRRGTLTLGTTTPPRAHVASPLGRRRARVRKPSPCSESREKFATLLPLPPPAIGSTAKRQQLRLFQPRGALLGVSPLSTTTTRGMTRRSSISLPPLPPLEREVFRPKSPECSRRRGATRAR